METRDGSKRGRGWFRPGLLRVAASLRQRVVFRKAGLHEHGLKTYRKRNALMMFGMQSPADALKSGISHSIIEQVATKILLPNPNATERDYVDGLNLTPAEYRLIRTELAPESRRFLVKQGHDSVVVELDLDGMDDASSMVGPLVHGRAVR